MSNIDKFGHTVHKRLRIGDFFSSEKTFSKTLEGHISAQSKRLTDLQNPIQPSDAVTKNYLEEQLKIIKKEIQSIKTNIKKLLSDKEAQKEKIIQDISPK